jgi:hypothetical protein
VTARSIILESFSGFRDLIHPGRIIGHIQGFKRVVPVWGFCNWRRRHQYLGSILQEEAIIALIYHLEEFCSIWESSSSGGPNPWSPLSSIGRTNSLRVRLNPSLYWSVHLILQPLGGLLCISGSILYATHIIVLKPSKAIPDLLLYCIRCLLSYNKVQILLWFLSCVLLRSSYVEMFLV